MNDNIITLYKNLPSKDKGKFLNHLAKELDLKYRTVSSWFAQGIIPDKHQEKTLELMQNWHVANYQKIQKYL